MAYQERINNFIIDSALSLERALRGKEIPKEIKESLSIVSIKYLSYDGLVHQGQLVVHKSVSREIVEIFEELLEQKFPIEIAVPVSEHEWDDNASMQVNNTSAFNYRKVQNTDVLSSHALGLAIDINPRINPYVHSDGTVLPPGARYNPKLPGTLISESPAVKAFTDLGWTWGGSWNDLKDYQHFEKRI